MFDKRESGFSRAYQQVENCRTIKELMEKMLECFCKKGIDAGIALFQKKTDELKLEYPKSNPSITAELIDMFAKEAIESMQKKKEDELTRRSKVAPIDETVKP